MADVEAMHSRNRVLSRCAFHSISAKFINREAKTFMEEASVLQKTEDCESLGGPAMGSDLVKVHGPKAKAAKGESALHLFRKRYLSQLQEKVNPCSREMWHEVKGAFENLPQDQRAVYDRLAEESSTNAALVRSRMRSGQLAPCSSENGQTSLVEQSFSEAVMLHTQVLPLWKLVDVLTHCSTVEQLAIALGKQFAQNGKVSAKLQCPISESTLETAFHGLASNGLTGRQAEKQFQAESERIGRPPETDVFPEKVVHLGVCGELCRRVSKPSRIALHRRLETLFQEVVSKSGGVQGSVASDPLCGFAEIWVSKNQTYLFREDF